MKFFNLFKKELKELLTAQVIIGILVSLVVFYAVGGVMASVTKEAEKEKTTINIVDNDQTDFSKSILNIMKASGLTVKNHSIESNDFAKEINKLDISTLIIIPKGFSDSISSGKTAKVEHISRIDALGSTSQISSATASVATEIIEQAIKTAVFDTKYNMSDEEMSFLDKPINVNETTVVKEASQNVGVSRVKTFVTLQTIFMPIIMFLLILYSAQMIISAISTEKIDKTLETLLSTPISRINVLVSKMLAAAIVAGLSATVYMIGFSGFMDKMIGSAGASSKHMDQMEKILENLNLTLSTGDYIIIGAQMFLSLMITLAIALVLGVLAKDVKSAQGLVMPIMFVAFIPYMLSLVVDINTLSPIVKVLVYAIPYTHAFTASNNILLGNTGLLLIGFGYQFIILIVCMIFAVRVFMTDKIFTMTLSFKKKSGKSKKSLFSKFSKKA